MILIISVYLLPYITYVPFFNPYILKKKQYNELSNKEERGITMSKEWFKTRILEEFTNKKENMTLFARRWPEPVKKRSVFEEESIYYSEEFGLKIIFTPLYVEGHWTTQIQFEDYDTEIARAWANRRDLTNKTLKSQVFYEERIELEGYMMFLIQDEVFFTFEDSCFVKNKKRLIEEAFDFESKKFINFHSTPDIPYPFMRDRKSEMFKTYVDAVVDDSLFKKILLIDDVYLTKKQKNELIKELKKMNRTKKISHISQLMSYLQSEYVKKP